MKIFGIGTDIVEVERIRKLDSLEKFADKMVLPVATPNSDPSWFGFPITIKESSI